MGAKGASSMHWLSLVLTSLFFAGQAFATPVATLGPITFQSPDPKCDLVVSFAPDFSAMSIIYNGQFTVQAGTGVSKTVDSQTCIVKLMMQVPNGYIEGAIDTDYRGFHAIPVR